VKENPIKIYDWIDSYNFPDYDEHFCDFGSENAKYVVTKKSKY
jgi:hypothetical protein